MKNPLPGVHGYGSKEWRKSKDRFFRHNPSRENIGNDGGIVQEDFFRDEKRDIVEIKAGAYLRSGN